MCSFVSLAFSIAQGRQCIASNAPAPLLAHPLPLSLPLLSQPMTMLADYWHMHERTLGDAVDYYGLFLDNADQPRIAGRQADRRMLQNALAFILTARG